MRKLVATICLVASPAIAGAPDMDEFLSSKGNSQDRWRTILLAECIGAQNQEISAMLYADRKLGNIPPFSEAWCIKNNHAPKHKDRRGT